MVRIPFRRLARLLLAVAMLAAAVVALAGPSSASSSSCNDGSLGCPWQHDDIVTFSRDVWGSGDSQANSILQNWWFIAANNSSYVLGSPSTTRTDSFVWWTNAEAYLAGASKVAPFGPLAASLLNPITDASGPLGPEVLSLIVNVQAFDDDLMPVYGYPRFGDLTMCDMPTGLTALDGATVASVLPILTLALSNEPGSYSYADLGALAQDLNQSFDLGVPSNWAQQHLFSEGCQSANIVATGPAHVQQVGKSATVSATATIAGSGTPIVGMPVQFAVSGANTANGYGYTNSSGVATFSYTGASAGVDTVVATTDFFNTDLNRSASASLQWSASPGELRVHGPGSTLYAGSRAGVAATVAANGTATFNAEIVNISDHAANFYLEDQQAGGQCGASQCPLPLVKMTAGTTGLTFNPLSQTWGTTNPLAAGAALAVTITVKMPAGATPGVGFEQEVTLLSADGISMDGAYLLDAVTQATGTHANDLFATVSGNSKTGAAVGGSGFAAVSPAVLTVGKTTTATLLVKNDSSGSAAVTTTVSSSGDCAADFLLSAKAGTTVVDLYSGYQVTLAAKASVTITVTLKADAPLQPGCNPNGGLWYLATTAAGAPTQTIDLIGNEQAT